MPSDPKYPIDGPEDDGGRDRTGFAPLILVVDDQEWTSRSLESILQPRGHAVVRAYTGAQAIELARKVAPDAILVDFHLPDMDGIEVVTELRRSPTVSAATPILMISTSNLTRAARLSALGAGVWDVLRHPLKSEEFILRLDNFVRVKQRADQLRQEGLADPETGFYNAQGLIRRAREISAEARRLEREVAVIVLGGDLFEDPASELPEELTSDEIELVEALRTITRASDALGRLPSGEFVVVASGADGAGAVRLIDRLRASFDEAGLSAERRAAVERLQSSLRGGYYATRSDSPTDPEELLLRATKALRRAQTEEGSGGFRVRAYEA